MTLTVILSALCAVIIFGASPVAAKIAVSGLAALDVAILRTVIGGIAALPLAFILKIKLPESSEQKVLLYISGFCGFIGFPVLFTFGVHLTSANHASMILASLPIFTSAIAIAWDRQKPKLLWAVGCAIALAGEYILITGFSSESAQSSITGDMLVLLSNLFASVGYVAGGRLQRQGYSALGTTFWGVAIFGLLLIPVMFFISSPAEIQSASFDVWLAVLYLAIGVTIVGYIMWYWALGVGGIAKVSLFQFLQPVSGVILAWWLLSEHLTLTFFIASSLVLAGVWVAIKAK